MVWVPTAGGRSTRSRRSQVHLALLKDRPAIGVSFQVLGPLVARRDAQICNLGGRRQRTVLAVLLANRNRVVLRDELIEAVWAGRPPSAAKTSLHAYLSHLRGALGGGTIGHADGGYLIEVDGKALDAIEFADLVETGGTRLSADPQGASECLDRALQLWRGPAFGDLGDEPALLLEVAHLSELRIVAEAQRIDAHLMLGHHETVIGPLTTLVKENPFRERFQGQLMLALYRSGRQADALRSFADARRRYAEELGVDPSPHLWRLEERILSHDSGLVSPSEADGLIPAVELEAATRGSMPATVAVADSVARRVSTTPESGRGGFWSGSKRPARRPRRSGIGGAVVGVLLIGGLVALMTSGAGWRGPGATQSECFTPSVPPTGWWSGDHTPADMVGPHDAALLGHAEYGPGLVNGAFALSGLGHLEVPDDPALDMGTRDFAVDLWLRFDSTRGEQVLVEKWVQKFGATSLGWTVTKLADDRLGFYTEGPHGHFGVTSDQLHLPIDRWIHVAAVRRSDTIELFLGGMMVASYEESGSGLYDIRSDSSIKFGHRGDLHDTPGSDDTRGMHLAGNIDEIHLWSGKALNATDIRGLVAAREGGICPPS